MGPKGEPDTKTKVVAWLSAARRTPNSNSSHLLATEQRRASGNGTLTVGVRRSVHNDNSEVRKRCPCA
jgi:hypothetical protein